MAKKRVIYTLLYSDGNFMLSRNFRLQRAGDVKWLLKNYHFISVAACIDELLIIDVSRGPMDRQAFLSAVRTVTESCFIPVALGGQILDFQTAASFIASGADKIVVNSAFDTDPDLVRRLADVYGSQCVIGGMDLRKNASGGYDVLSSQASKTVGASPRERLNTMLSVGAGEILVQSVDRDGTGNGFDFDMLEALGLPLSAPLILCGGCGRSDHMLQALTRPEVDAVATANLFNFIGDGLQKARSELLDRGLNLARWQSADVEKMSASVGRG